MAKTITSREFNQNVSAAKREAEVAPVIITDRGKPAFVLVSIERFRFLSGERNNIVEMLAMSTDLDFEPAPLSGGALQVPDLV